MTNEAFMTNALKLNRAQAYAYGPTFYGLWKNLMLAHMYGATPETIAKSWNERAASNGTTTDITEIWAEKLARDVQTDTAPMATKTQTQNVSTTKPRAKVKAKAPTKVTKITAKATKAKPKAKVTAAVAPVTVRRTHIAYVLDRSSSMANIVTEAQGIAAAQLRAVQESIAAEPKKPAPGTTRNEYTATAVSFANDVRVERVGIDPLALHTPFENFRANGMTALYDATRAAIESLKSINTPKTGEDAYMVLVVTDGGENASTKTTKRDLVKLIGDCEATGNWTIAFMVPRGGEQTLTDAGISPGNIRVWEATQKGARDAAATVYASTQAYTVNRTNGITRTASYFVDAAPLTVKKVAKALDDVTSQYRRINVKAEGRIDDVINDAGETFIKGNTYYELTKPEKVQAGKNILIQRKKEKTIYGGDNADVCAMLGLPEGEKRLKPGNLGDWRVFVLSKADNRICVRGTDLLWRKA